MKEVTRNKCFKLILAKVLHIYNFIKNILRRESSPSNFFNFFEFLGNFWTGSGYRAYSAYVLSL